MSQGQGRWTPRKEAGFAGAIAASLHVGSTERLLPWPYWWADLNAGSGWNEKANCPGSPLVFLNEALRFDRRVNACFCDNDPELAERLAVRLVGMNLPRRVWTWVRCLDNGEFLDEFGGAILQAGEDPLKAVGAVLCDPNGFRHGFPLEALTRFATRFPRMDLILNLNANLFRSVRGCKRSAREVIRKGFVDWPDPEEIVIQLARPHWLIRNPPACAGNGGGHVFVALVGSGIGYGPSAPREFYRLDSSTGQAILKYLRRVVADQPDLPFPSEETP